MRSAPVALKNYLAANNVAWRADLLTLTLLDTTVFRWTTWATDLVVGGNTFRAAGANGPQIKRSRIQQNARLKIDEVEVSLFSNGYTVGGKSLQLFAAQGWFDGARVQIDHLVMPTPGDVSLGAVTSWFEGRVGAVRLEAQEVSLHIDSELAVLNQPLPKFRVQAACGYAVYDANCGLNRASFTLTGTVSAATSSSLFATASAAITAKATGYFELGVLQFTSGALNGQKRAVSKWVAGANQFTMALPFTGTPGVGDSFSVYPGCDRKRATCLNRFNNLVAFRGFPHIPAPESAK
jgi:uncharacterized phage protein (TIGR02218 family)